MIEYITFYIFGLFIMVTAITGLTKPKTKLQKFLWILFIFTSWIGIITTFIVVSLWMMLEVILIIAKWFIKTPTN